MPRCMTMKRNYIMQFVIFLMSIAFAPQNVAADASVRYKTFGGVAIDITGTIKPNDYKVVKNEINQYLKSRSKSSLEPFITIFLDTNGGDVGTAINIGKYLRNIKAEAIIDDDASCLSSCVFVLAGASSREIFGRVGSWVAEIRRFYMFCPKCGKEIADDAVICIGCGRAVIGASPAVAVAGNNIQTNTSAAPTGKFNPMALLFNTSYYAGYGKVGKAMLLAVVGFIPLTLIPVAIYMGFSANKELPVGQIPFHWGKAIGVGIFQALVTIVVVSALKG